VRLNALVPFERAAEQIAPGHQEGAVNERSAEVGDFDSEEGCGSFAAAVMQRTALLFESRAEAVVVVVRNMLGGW